MFIILCWHKVGIKNKIEHIERQGCDHKSPLFFVQDKLVVLLPKVKPISVVQIVEDLCLDQCDKLNTIAMSLPPYFIVGAVSLRMTSWAPPSTMEVAETMVSLAFFCSSGMVSAPQLHMVERTFARDWRTPSERLPA